MEPDPIPSIDNWDIDLTCFEEPLPTEPSPEPLSTPIRDISVVDFRRANSLVLSGGGMKGIFLLGALQYLYQLCGLDHIQCYHGTSIGAAICTFLIIGYTPVEIMAYLCVHQIPKKIGEIGDHILKYHSLFNAEVVVSILNEMIIKKIGKVPTLKELYEKTNRDLFMVTIDRSNLSQPIYLNHTTHPDLLLSEAVHMSISIPFIFGYASYGGKKYIDGGLLDNFPIVHASTLSNRVFGIDIMTEHSSDTDNLLFEFLTVIMAPLDYIKRLNKQTLPEHAKYIELVPPDNSPMQTIDFSTSNKGIEQMFTFGYRCCKEKMTKEKND